MPLTTDPQTLETAHKLVSTLRKSFGTPDAYRPAHAKGHLIKGTFTPSAEASSLSTAPHFQKPSSSSSPIPILARFSNSTGLPTIPDTSSSATPHGLAIRFLLSANGHHHTDIITHSTPYFPSRTGEDFLDLLEAIGNNTVAEYLQEHPAAAAFVHAPKPAPESLAMERFYGVNAFKLVNESSVVTYIRYRIFPLEEKKEEEEESSSTRSKEEEEEEDKLPPPSKKNDSYLFSDLQTRLSKTLSSTIKFQLEAQIADMDHDIVDDATIHWPEERTVVTLGILTLETYEEEEESLREQQHVIFDPIPRVEGIEPSEDPILEMRAALYLISGRIRRQAA